MFLENMANLDGMQIDLLFLDASKMRLFSPDFSTLHQKLMPAIDFDTDLIKNKNEFNWKTLLWISGGC